MPQSVFKRTVKAASFPAAVGCVLPVTFESVRNGRQSPGFEASYFSMRCPMDPLDPTEHRGHTLKPEVLAEGELAAYLGTDLGHFLYMR